MIGDVEDLPDPARRCPQRRHPDSVTDGELAAAATSATIAAMMTDVRRLTPRAPRPPAKPSPGAAALGAPPGRARAHACRTGAPNVAPFIAALAAHR